MTIFKAKNGHLVNLDAVTSVSPVRMGCFNVHLIGGNTSLLAEEHLRFTESWINEFDAEVLEK